MINVEDAKIKIIEFLNTHGPSLPIKISSHIKVEPVFTSAILSELSSVHKLELSNMRVGSSRIYYLKGQESGLEKFAEEYLSGVVKRAYLLIKEKKFLIDSEEEPALRVALRSLKDFAIPFEHEDKLMWRYAFFPKEEIKVLIEKQSNPQPEKIKNSEEKTTNEIIYAKEGNLPAKESNLSAKENEREEDSTDIKIDSNDIIEVNKSVIIKNDSQEIINSKTPEAQKQTPSDFQKKIFSSPIEMEKTFEENHEKKEQKTLSLIPNSEEDSLLPKNELSTDIVNYLKDNKFKLLKIHEDSRSEFSCTIEVNSDLGLISFFLIAKNKKSLNDQDLLVAHQKSSEHKMPCLFLYKGKLTKRADELILNLKNLVILKKYV